MSGLETTLQSTRGVRDCESGGRAVLVACGAGVEMLIFPLISAQIRRWLGRLTLRDWARLVHLHFGPLPNGGRVQDAAQGDLGLSDFPAGRVEPACDFDGVGEVPIFPAVPKVDVDVLEGLQADAGVGELADTG